MLIVLVSLTLSKITKPVLYVTSSAELVLETLLLVTLVPMILEILTTIVNVRTDTTKLIKLLVLPVNTLAKTVLIKILVLPV